MVRLTTLHRSHVRAQGSLRSCGLIRITVAVMKHNDRSNLERKLFIHHMLPYQPSSSKEIRIRTQAGQEPVGRNSCRGHGGVQVTGLLSLLSYKTQYHQPREVPLLTVE